MWYEFNDMRVNIIGDKIINFNDDYTLFYKRSKNESYLSLNNSK